jgi:hypothetical protein
MQTTAQNLMVQVTIGLVCVALGLVGMRLMLSRRLRLIDQIESVNNLSSFNELVNIMLVSEPGSIAWILAFWRAYDLANTDQQRMILFSVSRNWKDTRNPAYRAQKLSGYK